MNAFILGGAACVWDDLRALKALTDVSGWTCICINDAGWAYRGHMHHWVTVHPEKLKAWREIREREQPKANRNYLVWSSRQHKLVDVQVPDSWAGGSGLTALRVARILQSTRTVLCGMPLENQPHFDRPGDWVKGPPSFTDAFKRRVPDLKPFVRSMSGNTAEWFGMPDAAWLEERRVAAA